MKLVRIAPSLFSRNQLLELSSSLRGDFERPRIVPGRAFDRAGDVAVDGGEVGPSFPSLALRAASTLKQMSDTCRFPRKKVKILT